MRGVILALWSVVMLVGGVPVIASAEETETGAVEPSADAGAAVEAYASPFCVDEYSLTLAACPVVTGKELAVCLKQTGEVPEGLVYRYGEPDAVEMEIFADAASNNVMTGAILLAEGSGQYLRFKNRDTEYAVYSAAGGDWYAAGVGLVRDNALVREFPCKAELYTATNFVLLGEEMGLPKDPLQLELGAR